MVRPEFPRIYRLARGYRIATHGVGIGLIALWVAVFSGQPSWRLGALFLPLCLFSVYVMAFAARACAILHDDRLEARWAFTRRRMQRTDIGARRLVPVGHGQTALRLYSRSGASDLTLPAGLVTDAEFDAWFEQPQPPTTTE